MVFNDMCFLSANFYEKDGQPRCYATFASYPSGEVFRFACHHWRKSDQLENFDVVDINGEIRQFGQNVSFILHDVKPVGGLFLDKGVDLS